MNPSRARLASLISLLAAVVISGGVFSSAPVRGQPAALDSANHSSQAEFRSRFQNPPAECRILKIIHSWPDDSTNQDALIRRLANQGFGGVVCNVSFTDYLESESRWKAFVRAVEAAKKAGFALWLYDEKGYPSGTAGGLVLKEHPEWQALGLLVADTETDGGAVTLPAPPGRLFLAAAFPLQDGEIALDRAKDLASLVLEGKLAWQAPTGRWRVMLITESRLFEGTHAALSLSEHIPYPNLLQPEPTARFLELTHQRYAEHLGADLGHFFVSTFTDEPSLMSLFLRPMPYRVLPWSPELPTAFKRASGYDLAPLVPALVADAGPRGAKARYDFWRTVAEAVSENYFGQIQRWCGAHQVLSGGHLLMEENLVNQVPLYGDFFRCLRKLDAPGVDCLTSLPEQVPWFIARLAGSAADLEDRTVTMCETSDHSQRYRPPGDQRPVRQVTPGEIRGTCNRLLVNGIDTITSYYSFDGLADEELRGLNAWVGRCSVALEGGHQVADLAVLYPTESVWPRFTPARHYANDSAAAAQIESTFHDASDSLFAAGRDFAYVDSRALTEAKVENATLAHGKLRWRVVVLPGADTLPRQAWDNLSRFVQAGGILVSLGSLPANSDTEFPSARVTAFARLSFGEVTGKPQVTPNKAGGAGIYLPAGCSSLLPRVLDAILEPDVKLPGMRGPICYTHRRVDGREVYFLINDGDQPWTGSIELSVSGTGERCDPASGEIRSVDGDKPIALRLPAYGGAVFRFPAARLPRRLSPPSSLLPNLVLRDLPRAQPLVARGEFVRADCTPETAAYATNPPAWRVTATLTKGQVDTYLFTRFIYAEPPNLQDDDSLVLDTSVPETQHTPSQLLVILHERNGADYLASTGRLLGAPGSSQVYVPLKRFQLAGWSSDANGRLDLTTITEIRVGWGGYYGTEGEKVQFTLSALRAAAFR